MMENSSSPKHDIDENHSRKNEINSSSNRNPRRSHASTSLNQRLSVNKSGANSVKFKPGMFRQAVPQMPLALACFCFVLNLILPGTGTLITAFAVFCCGKHGYEKNIVACLYNLLAAILQSATIFLLVGWIWSVRWGILFIQLAGNKNVMTQPIPFYVRRQSSVETHTQPFMTHMLAPRVPPLLEDTNEFEGV
ncbi:unnamed protein product [Rotaria magnacalcarata]|uniref:Protein SPEC3 n=1 Tax=Rotaria magnacalcarata TaxID=392030 RepID=A0A816LM19_9BILA|nr:unnamed protein product [Rotaria magnacalcarata]CAF1678089.1 unnamed protein product [Rotaria magnacalcarata]CAF1934660.1 unnamed protein product [Rotaria magnacalcarata]CAF2069771.1 unnamed protein product [Rotaria magnacalcarata]CAF2147450.1 unnamed protein product [Rotaria magnacalcarata]